MAQTSASSVSRIHVDQISFPFTKLIRQSSQAIRPPTSILSLPSELLSSVVSHLERSDAISFALTARRLITVTEPFIARHLDLFLHHDLGVSPSIQPYAEGGSIEYVAWAKGEMQMLEDRRRELLRKKIRTVLLCGERRLKAVESITLSSMSGALHGTVQVLEMISAHLRTLQLRHFHGLSVLVPLPPFHQTLEYTLLGSHIHFPTLTCVTLDDLTISYSNFLLALCAAAPNLEVLAVGEADYIAVYEDDLPAFPSTLPRATKLRQLQVSLGTVGPESPVGDEAARFAEPILTVLEHSPVLRQADIRYHCDDEVVVSRLASFLAKQSNLQALHLTMAYVTVNEWFGEAHPVSSVIRLALVAERWSDIFLPPTHFPNLEVLVLFRNPPRDQDQNQLDLPELRASIPARVCAMIPLFAEVLHSSPRLHAIHTPDRGASGSASVWIDGLASSENLTARIRSFCHAGDELLHASFFSELGEESDEVIDDDEVSDDYENWYSPILSYMSRQNTYRRKTFVRLPQAVWSEHTDFRGVVVPLEIIQDMRRVQGATEAEWQGRGIEVGKAAWRVLTDWAEVHKEEEALDEDVSDYSDDQESTGEGSENENEDGDGEEDAE